MGTAEELKILQGLPLEVKVKKTKLRIKEWYEAFDGNVYISVSGGKDSQVLAHIVKEIYPDVPCVFVDTGLEYSSVRDKGMELADKVIKPEKSFFEIITQYGYPVASKEVAHKIHDNNTAKRNGKTSYVLKQFDGNYVSKNGKTNMVSVKRWKFLLNAPFRISHICCNYSKRIHRNIMKKKPVLSHL